MEYPNELVEAVKAVANAINGEGGGGGDISTAEVTFKNTSPSGSPYYVYITKMYDGEIFVDKIWVTSLDEIVTVPLGPNGYILGTEDNILINVDTSVMPSYEGDVELGEFGFVITGDCTFSFAGETQT